MLSGSMTSVARSRKKTVSSTALPSSWPISSSPVASGTREYLLRADCAIALAPAHVGIVEDHLAQLEHAVHERLGPRRAARDMHVDREELVGGDEGVVVED